MATLDPTSRSVNLLRAVLDPPGLSAAGGRRQPIRALNERRVLSLLRAAPGLSRADIARRLRLTRSTVTSLVDALLARDLLLERASDAADARVGRPGGVVTLRPDGGIFAGIEIGYGVVRAVLLDLSLQRRAAHEEAIPERAAPGLVLDLVQRFIAGQPAAVAGRLRAIGLTVPGLVASDGLVVHLPMVGWRGVDLAGAVQARTGLPVLVENDANAAAFAETYDSPGTEKAQEVLLLLRLGAGCGGAAVLGGRLLRGAAGSAAEFGHLRVADDGPVCACGRVGCLEPRVNAAALRRALGARAEGVAEHELPEHAATLIDAGDPVALAALRALIADLARGLVTLVHVFNPSRVVLSGTARPLLQRALPALQAALRTEVLPGVTLPALTLSRLGLHDSAAGAAMLAHHAATGIVDFDRLARSIG